MKGSYNLYSYDDASGDDNDNAGDNDDANWDDASDDDRDESLVGFQHNHLL